MKLVNFFKDMNNCFIGIKLRRSLGCQKERQTPVNLYFETKAIRLPKYQIVETFEHDDCVTYLVDTYHYPAKKNPHAIGWTAENVQNGLGKLMTLLLTDNYRTHHPRNSGSKKSQTISVSSECDESHSKLSNKYQIFIVKTISIKRFEPQCEGQNLKRKINVLIVDDEIIF